MVNAFNEYFATNCTNKKRCNNNTDPHTSYLKASIHSTLIFKTIYDGTALQYFSNLHPFKNFRHDNIYASSQILSSTKLMTIPHFLLINPF